MQITNQLGDEAVLGELGQRLARTRLDRNLTQQELAAEAGVSTFTIYRLEHGRSVAASALVRVLRALELLASLDGAIPPPLPSPIEQLELEGGRRRRAAGAHRTRPRDEPESWRWGTR